jgi:hypothetical protein
MTRGWAVSRIQFIEDRPGRVPRVRPAALVLQQSRDLACHGESASAA